ncbi:hypothetical protein NEMIN01_1969 [Nematocida minor]|uniref:uncharacterized protein n=1 Tax=Nematocida minor TaxID=1912983 RepID=UPI00221E4B8A|nr:uncharacterized protein NEMIN01_1969 [Nematocida minor]KAI5192355.1 hypothetical protein NEMIN01_1969 [Nematocida minor]
MERLSVVEYLTMRYLNEREAKRLLPYDEDLVERVQFLLQRQKTRQQEEENKNRIKEHIYKIEIDRLEWMLTEYLLLRLEKIRNNFYIKNEQLLSEKEKEYYTAYILINKEEKIYTPLKDIPERHKEKNSTEVHGIYVLDTIQDIAIDGEMLSFSPGEFLIGDIAQAEELVNDLSVLLV